jgi:hypothetical protein
LRSSGSRSGSAGLFCYTKSLAVSCATPQKVIMVLSDEVIVVDPPDVAALARDV